MKRLARAIANFRRGTNIETRTGFLGDGSGETHDRSNPGNFWVRFPAESGTLSAPISLPLMVNANLKPDDGIAVEVGVWKDRPVILGARLDGLGAAGINPIQLNPADPTNQYVGFVHQRQITTLQVTRHLDLTNKPFYAVVLPGFVYANTTASYFAGGEIDLSGLVPSSGDHCLSGVFIKRDMTLAAFASTAINNSDPLTDVDILEVTDAATAGSTLLWAFILDGDDVALTVDPARQLDMRQLVSTDIRDVYDTVVTSQFDKTSSATLANITGLSARVISGRTYIFEAILFVTVGAGGHKYAVSGTCTATSIVYDITTIDLTSQQWDICVRASALNTSGGEATGTSHQTTIRGTITVNATGTLTVQFAQNSSNGATSSVLVGSSFSVREVV